MNFPLLLLLLPQSLHSFSNKSHVQYNCTISSVWEIQQPMNMGRTVLLSVSRKVSDIPVFSNLQNCPGSFII